MKLETASYSIINGYIYRQFFLLKLYYLFLVDFFWII